MIIKKKELTEALKENDFNKIELLIEKYGIKGTDKEERTILMNCLYQGKAEFAQKLLDYEGLEINQQDNKGNSALHYSIYTNNVDIVKQVISKKAIIDLQNNRGNTPLYETVFCGVKREIVDVLMAEGAYIDLENGNGVSPLHLMLLSQPSKDFPDYSDIITTYREIVLSKYNGLINGCLWLV